MNLYRFVKSLGMRPLVCGNIKGLQDFYRTPETQARFAKEWNQTPEMVTSFADGTKIAFEQVLVANATGMKVAQRGMIGIKHDGHVDELTGRFDIDQLRSLGGIVDYARSRALACLYLRSDQMTPRPTSSSTESLETGRSTVSTFRITCWSSRW